MQLIGFVLFVFQLLYYFVYFLDLVGVGDQQCIGSIYYDQVVDFDCGDQVFVVLYEGVMGVDEQGVVVVVIVFCVCVEQCVYCVLGIDIVLVEGCRYYGDLCGVFYQCIVDGNVWQCGEGFVCQFMLDVIGYFYCCIGGQVGFGLFQQGWGMLCQFVDQG